MTDSVINDILEKLAVILRLAMVADPDDEDFIQVADVVYDYRTLGDTARRTVALTCVSNQPIPETVGGRGGFVEFTAILIYPHDKTQESMRVAEFGLNLMEMRLINALFRTQNNLWRKVEFRQKSIRPPAPAEAPRIRFGEITFVVHLR